MQRLRSTPLIIILSIILNFYPNQLLASYVAQDMQGSVIAFNPSTPSAKESSISYDQTKKQPISKRLRPSTLKEKVKRSAKIGAIIGGVIGCIALLFNVIVITGLPSPYSIFAIPEIAAASLSIIIATFAGLGALSGAAATVILSKHTTKPSYN